MYNNDEIMEFVSIVAEIANPERIILFGSYAYGYPDENSDVDLLVIKNDKELTRDEHAELGVKVFDKRRQRKLKMRADVFYRTDRQVRELTEDGSALIDALQRGRVVYERSSQ
ncbi:MAG: nucleotidyltransferase domain-containing protein [Oscillospiraceae bacterium]|jgi:predicted nucleotidyltransferase|nr:nucleotidyltransferase domain-containing protein [Oscillospiraceae bacterium]